MTGRIELGPEQFVDKISQRSERIARIVIDEALGSMQVTEGTSK